MTEQAIREVIVTIKYPGAVFTYEDEILRTAWTAKDTDDPAKTVTVYSRKHIWSDSISDERDLIQAVRRQVLSHLEHEADELFSVNGTKPFHPHAEDAYDDAIIEDGMLSTRKIIPYSALLSGGSVSDL